MRNSSWCLISVFTFVLSSLLLVTEAEGNIDNGAIRRSDPPYSLCSGISKELLKGVKASKRKTRDGIIVVMTCPDPKIVALLKETISRCRSRAKFSPDKNPGRRDILAMLGVKIRTTNLNNGIRLQLISEDPKLVEKIWRVRLPGFPRRRFKREF